MNLFSAYCVVCAVFCILGAFICFFGFRSAALLNAFPRSQTAGVLLWSSALAWFFYYLATMSEVDFAGFPRWSFFAVFGGAGLLAFKFLKDLLPLRALAVLTLFSCNELLKIGFGQVPDSWVLAGTAYLLIIAALWIGAAPYVLRNAITFTTQSEKRSRLVGTALLAIGIANGIALLFV